MSEPVMSVDEAIEIVARQVVSNAISAIEWESYPEIGYGDWVDVIRCAHAIVANRSPFLSYRAAYKVLEDRAKEFEDD